MKRLTRIVPLLAACLLGSTPVFSADKAPAPAKAAAPAEKSEVSKELAAIVSAVREKLKAGKTSADDLADELKRFDALIANHGGEKSEDVARAAMMQAQLYIEVIKDEKKGTEMLKQVAKDYPGTAAAATVEKRIAAIEMREKLAVGKPFPPLNVKDLDDKALSTADYKGKVVLIDFWATWCGPCVGELPNVVAAYKKYHADGFEIIGISLDQNKAKLTDFMGKNEMTWRQYFDGEGWKNKVAQDYGINSIPATFLLDREGTIIGRDLRGPALEAALEKAMKKPEK